MSTTPLSDRITRQLETESERDYELCLQAFLDAELGLWIPGFGGRPGERVDASGLPLPRFSVGDGLEVLRVCADPDVFKERYDPRLNVRVMGREALELLLKLDDDIQGILLASAASEHSLFIPRSDAQRLLESGAQVPASSWWSRLRERFTGS